MISQTPQLSTSPVPVREGEGESTPRRVERCAMRNTSRTVLQSPTRGVENSRRKRSLPDVSEDPTPDHDSREHINLVASTSALVSAPSTKRAKRAETRECPVCGEHIPLRLLGRHYKLESSRVQTILDHVGDLEYFADPHFSAHTQSVAPRRTTLQARDGSVALAARLAKTLSSIKRRRKARNMALRVVTRDEDDVLVAGKGKGRARAIGEQCPVCMQDVEGDPDVIAAHVDACLAHAELRRQVSESMDTDADADASRHTDGYADEGEDDMWEESEAPDGSRRVRLRRGARAGAVALGFVVGDRAVEDVDDEIDVEGDDLSTFGVAQFAETDELTRSGDSPSRRHMGRRVEEAEVELAIELARREEDSQALLTALERKVRLLTGSPVDGATFGCRICLEVYSEPTVSIGCWHVCCSACWLRCLNTSGVCPICKRITMRSDLRRIYL